MKNMKVDLKLCHLYMYTITLGIEKNLCIRLLSSKQINFTPETIT